MSYCRIENWKPEVNLRTQLLYLSERSGDSASLHMTAE